MLKRLDHLDVATSALSDAERIYKNTFGFAVTRSADGSSATVKVGGAEIQLKSDATAAAQIAQTGEGMVALWLEADDVEQVAAALRKANIAAGAIRRDGNRRVLSVDLKGAHQVPLFIFDRKV